MRTGGHRSPIVLLSFMLLAAPVVTWSETDDREPDSSARRALGTGSTVGFSNPRGGHAWLGLPFAQPPVAARRFRAPDPPAPLTDEHRALATGSACPQFASPLAGTDAEGVIGDEDCLYLNVFAPRFEADKVPSGDERLPVLFWIHGGGNTIGHGGTYDGGRLAAEQNVIVVTTNYRLGALGWFRHPALAAEARDARDASGNFGTLDLIRGLEWVRDHIEGFGGDPENVTIFGESAGGHNVFTLLVAPGAAGLFHRAISQSGGTWTEPVTRAESYAEDGGDAHSSREILVRLLAREGGSDARARANAMSADDLAAFLRTVSPGELLEAHLDEGETSTIGMYHSPRMFRDGTVLPEAAIPDALAAGDFHKVPVMLGTNRDETKLFMALDSNYVFRLFWLLPILTDKERYDRDAEYGSNLWKVSGVDAPAVAMVSAGNAAVYGYRFDWDEQGSVLVTDLSSLLGAAHGLEIPFVFDSFDTGLMARIAGRGENPERDELARAMRDYWAEFARTGDPGKGGNEHPPWTPWSPRADGAKFIALDSASDRGIRMSSDTLTRKIVLDGLVGDARFADTAERCRYMQTLVSFNDLEPAEYEARGCAAHPLSDIASH